MSALIVIALLTLSQAPGERPQANPDEKLKLKWERIFRAADKDESRSLTLAEAKKGLPKVLVPDVIGLGTDGANRAITDAGLKFEVKFQDVAAGSTQANKVISQSVIANTQVTKGSTVIVIIGRVPVVTTTTAVATTTTTPGATTTTSRP